MNPCKECIVDMVCIKNCPFFEVDIKRLQTDEEIYLRRCMNNIFLGNYKTTKNIEVMIYVDSIKWYKNGERHRDNNQPAIFSRNGTKQFYKDGKCHRDNDQPAVIFYNGTRYWYKNGNLHRDNDQPAIIYSGGPRYWFKDGVQYKP